MICEIYTPGLYMSVEGAEVFFVKRDDNVWSKTDERDDAYRESSEMSGDISPFDEGKVNATE